MAASYQIFTDSCCDFKPETYEETKNCCCGS